MWLIWASWVTWISSPSWVTTSSLPVALLLEHHGQGTLVVGRHQPQPEAVRRRRRGRRPAAPAAPGLPCPSWSRVPRWLFAPKSGFWAWGGTSSPLVAEPRRHGVDLGPLLVGDAAGERPDLRVGEVVLGEVDHGDGLGVVDDHVLHEPDVVGVDRAEGRGAAAVPVSEVFGSPGARLDHGRGRRGHRGVPRPGRRRAGASASAAGPRRGPGPAARRAARGRSAGSHGSVTGESLGGSFYPIQRDSVLFP